MRPLLESEEWEIIEAENGKEAVSKAEEFRPNLVILDLVMPVMNGLRASWNRYHASRHSYRDAHLVLDS